MLLICVYVIVVVVTNLSNRSGTILQGFYGMTTPVVNEEND
jgi:hypothetical protein